jgi:hypothetical protein
MIELEEVISFYAEGKLHFGDYELITKINCSFKKYAKDNVSIKAWTNSEKAFEYFDLLMQYPFTSWFDGITETNRSVLLLGIEPTLINGENILFGNVMTCIIYDKNINPNKEYKIIGRLSNSPVSIPEWNYYHSYNGTLTTKENPKDRVGITWENDLYSANLIDDYEFIFCNKENEGITLRRKTNKITITLKSKSSDDVFDTLKDLPHYLYNDCLLLSFIGRKRVSCHEAEMREIKNYGQIAFARYKSWEGFYKEPQETSALKTLIKQVALRDGLFQKIQEQFNHSDFRAVLIRTIPYLVTSYEDGYLETKLLNAYAALESMVDGIGQILDIEQLMNSSEFDKLSKEIRRIVKELISDQKNVNGIIKKIPELKRISILDKLFEILKIQNVPLDMLFSKEKDPYEEFRKIFSRRNELIHKGNSTTQQILEADLNIIQKLVELWIIKLVSCPIESLNMFDFMRINPSLIPENLRTDAKK